MIKNNYINGFLLLNKETNITSNQALQKCKKLFNANKAGHTGCLDPMSTGLLPILFGNSTKLSSYLLNSNKTYIATIKYGIETDTGDKEGKIINTNNYIPNNITAKKIIQIFKNLIGKHEQKPPMYSAIKYNGRKLYELARKGITVNVKKRIVYIHSLHLIDLCVKNQQIKIKTKVSKGTYIRSLAGEIGKLLGLYAHLIQLERIECGIFNIKESFSIQDIINNKNKTNIIQPSEKLFANITKYEILNYNILQIFYNRNILPNINHEGMLRIYYKNIFIAIITIIEKKIIHRNILTRINNE